MELDFIKEQILSIEDFDNVDAVLMERINNNEEYRRLFEELRELSALAASSVPAPEKDGVSLHDAVMNRVRTGEVAPKYIVSGRRYPIAAAACLLACFGAVLIARNGLLERFGAKNFNNAANESAVMDIAEEEDALESYNFADYGDTEGSAVYYTADSNAESGGVLVEFKSAKVFREDSYKISDAADGTAQEGEPSKAKQEKSGEEDAITDNQLPETVTQPASYDVQMPAAGGGASGNASNSTTSFSGISALPEINVTLENEEEAEYEYSKAVHDDEDAGLMFIYDGREYDIFEVYALYTDGTLGFDITSDEYDIIWKAIYERLTASESESEYNEEVAEFIKENYEASLNG